MTHSGDEIEAQSETFLVDASIDGASSLESRLSACEKQLCEIWLQAPVGFFPQPFAAKCCGMLSLANGLAPVGFAPELDDGGAELVFALTGEIDGRGTKGCRFVYP